MKLYLFLLLIVVVGLFYYLKCNNKPIIEKFNTTPPFAPSNGMSLTQSSLEDIEKSLKQIDSDLQKTSEAFNSDTPGPLYNEPIKTVDREVTKTEVKTEHDKEKEIGDVEYKKVERETIETEKKECPSRINVVQVPVDLSKYVLKTSLRPMERVDMSKYILKTQIPAVKSYEPNKYIEKSKIPSCMPVPKEEELVKEPEPIKKMDEVKETILRFVRSEDNPMNIENCRFMKRDNKVNIKFSESSGMKYTPTSKPEDSY